MTLLWHVRPFFFHQDFPPRLLSWHECERSARGRFLLFHSNHIVTALP
jgi:hypothetical protein